MAIGALSSPSSLVQIALGLLPSVSNFLGGSHGSSKLEVTKKSSLSCGAEEHDLTSGWVHLDDGKMFWTLFEADEGARDNGLVIYFEGGPGGSAFDYPFIGAGPCQLRRDRKDEEEWLEPAPYPWTKHANLLVLDYPVGAGFSTWDPETQVPPNSSAAAAQDFDIFLQNFLHRFPEYIEQTLVLSSLSYGGTTVSHIASTIYENNHKSPDLNRIRKSVDHIHLGNPFGDVAAELRWQIESGCDDKPQTFKAETCEHLRKRLPGCLDALAYVQDLDTVETRKAATDACVNPPEIMWVNIHQDRFYRSKPACYPVNTCFWWQDLLTEFMNLESTRNLLGAPSVDFKWMFVNQAFVNFILKNYDNMQYAFKLLSTSLESGTKLLVYSGTEDTICSWQSSLSWMRRLPSRYLDDFRGHGGEFTALPPGGVIEGEVMGAGTPYTLLKVHHAGHLVEEQQPQLMQEMVKAAVNGENYNPLKML